MLAEWINRQPLSSIATGQLSLWQCIGIYGLFAAIKFWPWWQKRWGLGLSLAIVLLVVPWGLNIANLRQITVLATPGEPVLLWQNRNKTLLFNSGQVGTASYTVLPFLRRAGINQLDWAIAPSFAGRYAKGWEPILAHVSAKAVYGTLPNPPSPQAENFVSLSAGQRIAIAKTVVQRLEHDAPLLRMTIAEQSWLLLPPLTADQQIHLITDPLPQTQVLWWDGTEIISPILDQLQPQTAICFGAEIDAATARLLRDRGIELYWPAQDGPLQAAQTDLDITL